MPSPFTPWRVGQVPTSTQLHEALTCTQNALGEAGLRALEALRPGRPSVDRVRSLMGARQGLDFARSQMLPVAAHRDALTAEQATALKVAWEEYEMVCQMLDHIEASVWRQGEPLVPFLPRPEPASLAPASNVRQLSERRAR